MPKPDLSLSLLIPTRNEEDNVLPLLERIERALANRPYEVLFVDDSDDETPARIREAQERFPNVKLIHRQPGKRSGGLSGAVVCGMNSAVGQWVCVMDADLQHPPELIPSMLVRAQQGCDLVAASRMAGGGGLAGLSRPRRWLSTGLAVLTRLLFPTPLSGISDPLTGFFVLRRSAFDPSCLSPNGFKILLDILVSTPGLKASEVPFQIQSRREGQSKAGLREIGRFFSLILQLKLRTSYRFFLFLAVGLSGILVNTAVLAFLTESLHIHYLVSAALATQGSTLWNFLLTERWVFGNENNRRAFRFRLASFVFLNNLFLVLRGPILAILATGLGIHYVLSNLISIGAMSILRYLFSRQVIWSKEKGGADQRVFYYDIHQFVRVASQAPLPELHFFRVPSLDGPPDLHISVRSSRYLLPGQGDIIYDEKLGDLGFWIRVFRGETTRVWASPMLSRSPHVLYTNVVEPLLRWKLVEKGYALVHGACISAGRQAVLVTARTDTGKTTTILKTLAQHPNKFLSDDMTILSPTGWLYAFPKPLTISRHTLQAIDTARLTTRERLFLAVQSNLHSRTGRLFGMIIGKLRLPAATLNALIQMLIPPPKFPIDRLVPGTEVAERARLCQVVVIERGARRVTRLSLPQTAAIVHANSEDAYGFPPYPEISSALQRSGDINLEPLEREIVRKALWGIPAACIADPHYGWWRRLPGYLHKTAPNFSMHKTRPRSLIPESKVAAP